MKKLIWIIPIIYLLALLGQQIFRSIVKIEKLKSEKKSKVAKKKYLEDEIEKYEVLIKNLNKSFYKEKIARDKLQMVFPDEQIYRLVNEKENEEKK